jgi:hypothetical protein
MDSKLLVGLIKEVVQREVKQQVKEELAKLIKSGAVTLNKERKQPSLMEMTEVNKTAPIKTQTVTTQIKRPQQTKEFTKNPILNEVLNMTQPFTAQQRAEGSMPGVSGGSSVLDMIQPQMSVEEDWQTMDFRDINVPSDTPSFETTGDGLQDATIKALTRDYSELVKRFK